MTSESGPSGSVAHGYDARGNETADGGRTFAYDLADRLVSTTAAGVTTSYGYDGDGNRLSAASGASTAAFLWDANNALPQLALERDGAGAVIRSYVFGRDTISMSSGGAPFFFHFDGLGSVVDVTDASGLGEWSYGYEPYGEERSTVKVDPAAPENPLRFTGEYRDDTGLYNLRAREYDPGEGRFLQQDPMESALTEVLDGGYVYADDQPTRRTDPSGMRPTGCSGPSCVESGSRARSPRLERLATSSTREWVSRFNNEAITSDVRGNNYGFRAKSFQRVIKKLTLYADLSVPAEPILVSGKRIGITYTLYNGGKISVRSTSDSGGPAIGVSRIPGLKEAVTYHFNVR